MHRLGCISKGFRKFVFVCLKRYFFCVENAFSGGECVRLNYGNVCKTRRTIRKFIHSGGSVVIRRIEL